LSFVKYYSCSFHTIVTRSVLYCATKSNEDNMKNASWGTAFLGRDEKTWGKDGIGEVPIDPNICPSPNQCPYYRDREYDLDNDKIHLVIASFRDQLCPRTLYNVFTRSKNPHRIFVRVLQQLQPDSDLVDDADCWEMACKTYSDKDQHKLNNGQPFDCQEFQSNVEMVTIDAGLAKGPCDARSKLSALIEYDYRHAKDGKHRLEPVDVRDYCMQTDSHMDFSTEFDNKLIAMFHRTENDRAVLSTYVASMEQNNKDYKEVPHLCMITFTQTWRNWGTKLIR
jgi:Glycosyltransferase (GlcNAc)